MEAATNRKQLPVWLTIIVGTTLLACVLGIAMDLVTANVAVEYFTVHHPKLVESESPWAMALLWGVAASWWAGVISGTVLAIVNARLRPPLEPAQVLRMAAVSCVFLWLIAMTILVGIYGLAGLIPVNERRATFEADRRLIAVGMAHLGEYVLAAVATLVVAFRMAVVSRRARWIGGQSR